MFCPRCATQNELELNYCRQCGLALSGARLDLESRGVDPLASVREGEKLIRNGTVTLVVFNLITLVVAITTMIITGLTTPTLLSIVLDLVLGLGIGVPLIMVGNAKLRRARGLLPGQPDASGHPVRGQSPHPELATSDLMTDLPAVPSPASVTDRTTLNLERPKRGLPKSS